MDSRKTERNAQEDDPSINLDKYVQYFLAAIVNKLARISTKTYNAEFGIGVGEWYVMALLASESDISATRICEVGGFDKAVVSRSVNSLAGKGYIVSKSVKNHNRKRLIRLTESGRELHNKIMDIALAREERLLEGLYPEDRAQLLRYLRIMNANASDISGDTG